MSVARYFNPRLRARFLSGDYPSWLVRHSRKDYIVAAVLSAPPWLRTGALLPLRARARELSKRTGVPHVLDHIVPVSHPYVCGLTVPWNMQVITRKANAYKSNRFSPDQIELFDENEQLSLL